VAKVDKVLGSIPNKKFLKRKKRNKIPQKLKLRNSKSEKNLKSMLESL
jgi:hypothetical protein